MKRSTNRARLWKDPQGRVLTRRPISCPATWVFPSCAQEDVGRDLPIESVAPTAGEQENLNEFKEIRRNQGVRANQFLPLFVILAESGLVMEVSMAISQWPIWYWNWHIIERLFPLTCSFWLDGRSKHSPEQARTRTCHVVPYGTDGKPQFCLATDCNAWRWTRHPLHWRNTFTRRRGRCATSDLRSLKA